MEQYNVTGMSCAACSARVEKAVEEAGYGASLKNKNTKTTNSANEDILVDKETPIMKKRLISSLIFLLILMYFSMGHMMFGWPVPLFFRGK